MKLNKLTRFYKDEKAGLPHDKADIWDLAWQLAEVMEDFSANCKLPSAWDSLDEFLAEIKSKPTSALIDIAVDALHQTLLAQSGEEYELIFDWLGQDIAAYLLSRNGDRPGREAKAWAESEAQKEADLDTIEEAYWQLMEVTP